MESKQRKVNGYFILYAPKKDLGKSFPLENQILLTVKFS